MYCKDGAEAPKDKFCSDTSYGEIIGASNATHIRNKVYKEKSKEFFCVLSLEITQTTFIQDRLNLSMKDLKRKPQYLKLIQKLKS